MDYLIDWREMEDRVIFWNGLLYKLEKRSIFIMEWSIVESKDNILMVSYSPFVKTTWFLDRICIAILPSPVDNIPMVSYSLFVPTIVPS